MDNTRLVYIHIFEALEQRRLLSGEPWGFFPHLLGQDLAVQNYPQLTGKGLTVAVIDSAVDYMHPALGGGFGPGFKISDGWNFVDNNSDVNVDLPSVNSVHATGVVGMLAANPFVWNNRRYQGIAPDVNVVVLREDTSAHVKQAMQWVIDHRVQDNIVAVNLTDFYEPTLFDASLYASEAAQLAAAGVFIAAPGGNLGATVPVSVSSPAADPNIYGTTGIDHTGAIVDYFQRDASIDALGPGNGVTLPYYDPTTQSHIYTDYGEGSSWSAPTVTGTAVLLKQINPAFTPEQIMSIIRESGTPTYDPVSGLTFPLLNVNNAIAMAYAKIKSAPFTGLALPLPGIIQAENFDYGGEGIAYHDTDAINSGNGYRTGGVDIEATGDTGGGYDVGWIKAGEWMNYTVNVPVAGVYSFDARVASLGAGGTFHLEAENTVLSGPITVPDTGGWQKWTTVTASVNLPAGVHALRLVFDGNGASGYIGNLNWVRLYGGPTPASTPYPGPNPTPITGPIEAENFDQGGEGVGYHDLTAGNSGALYRLTDAVDIEKCKEGGFDVGWNLAGEWLNYTVNVGADGAYTFDIRQAYGGANANGGIAHLEVDGTDVTGAITLAKTGGWQTWQTVSKSGINLTAGTHVLRLVFDKDGAGGTAGYIANINWIRLSGVSQPVVQQPYPGPNPAALPGTVEVENFDTGGEGVAYHDLSNGNSGAQYRASENIDIEKCSEGGYDVGWNQPGEWLKYTVNLASAGTYSFDIRSAYGGANANGGTVHLEVDGADVTGAVTLAKTGGWQKWQTVSKAGIALTAGQHVLRLVMDADGAGSTAATAYLGNINWFRISTNQAGPYPGPNPGTVPGRLELENFDTGGDGLGYHDLTAGNNGKQYRTTDNVDIEKCSEGGFDVGWNQPGEWLGYTVNVGTAGAYSLDIRTAYGGANASGGTVHLEVDGVDVSGPITLAKTGGWQTWQTVSTPGVILPAGQHALKLVFDKDGAGSTANSAYLGNVNWIALSVPPPP